MNITAHRNLFSWFTFWAILAVVCCYFLWPLRKTLRFGIDLVGGTFITLEVQTDKAVETELLSKLQSIGKCLKTAGKEQPVTKNVVNGQIILTFSSASAAQNAGQLIQDREKNLVVSTENQMVKASFIDRIAKKIKEDAVNRNVEVLRTRLNRLSVEEITIAAQGEKNIIVELPDVSDPQQAKEMIGRAAVLEFKLVQRVGKSPEDILYELDGVLPGDMEILPSQETTGGTPNEYYLVPKFADVSGADLRNARARLGDRGVVVEFQFSSEGGDKFYDLTSKNIGKPLAIVLDGQVVMAPRINAALRESGVIESSTFTPQSAKQLEMLLKSGAFVAPVTFEAERQIGPSLGAESIRQGLISCLVGLGLLFVFSVSFYSLCGILAFITLLYNLLLILVAMHFLRATLTLPGIAGLVLTVGMAIDSSILIYEQIKEALGNGMTIKKAVDTGFADAMVVILDANITTFIVGAVLYYFGTGPIKGFAIILMLGIISTLITGLFFLKSTFSFILNRFNVQKLWI
jgi:preprotein translocase subunit SecD